jgi:hypothetical protein
MTDAILSIGTAIGKYVAGLTLYTCLNCSEAGREHTEWRKVLEVVQEEGITLDDLSNKRSKKKEGSNDNETID